MERPLNLVVRGAELPPALEESIHERVATLERFYPRLIGCSIRVEGPGAHHRRGGPYEVRLDLSVPGAEPILVNRQSHERLERAVDNAFDVAARRLEDLLRLQRGAVKQHEEPLARARVGKFVAGEEYGFLVTEDGREVYFHRNSVLGDFGALRVGTAVRFLEEAGEKGPQASTVVIADGRDGRAETRNEV